MRTRDPVELIEAARAGDRAALARLLTYVEQGGDAARDVGRATYPLGGGAYTVGITGAPGAGKSTLTNGFVTALRGDGDEVAVLAVDPSSPFSGGAILGDRVRMQDHSLDHGVFIRSMATRGHLGGLALSTPEAVRVLDAAGFPWVFIETVGVGQVEVEVAGAADTTVVVVNPGWGDSVQANKAGLLEVADVFVVNKADRPGVQETRRDLDQMLDLTDVSGSHAAGWRPPIVPVVATTGTGVRDALAAIVAHREHLETTGELVRKRAARTREELRNIVTERLRQRAVEACRGETFDRIEQAMVDRRLDPWAAADQLLAVLPAE